MKEQLQLIEELLGNNLVWLQDQLDLQIRKADKDTIDRLAQINRAWVLTCKLLKEIA